MQARGEAGGQDWTDLAAHAPGIGISHEAARRRAADGLGADRSWRVGADGEAAVAQVLAELTHLSRWDRLRGRASAWRMLHSVPAALTPGESALRTGWRADPQPGQHPHP